MNLAQQFKDLLGSENLGIAEITGEKGGGHYAAQTEAGAPLLLKGSAKIGQKVFYNRLDNTIKSPAPNLNFIDIEV